MRQHLVMGNWKLNGTKASVEALIKGLTPAAAAHPSVQVAVCPPVIFLGLVEQLTAGSKIAYGAQNADVHESGAFTGENAPSMLKAFGCTYSLVGHSERRTLHAETDDVVAAKYEAIQKGGLIPVLCIGETLAQFEAGTTNSVVETQLKAVIDRCGIASFENAVVAYEPVWAIGTGKTATRKSLRPFTLTSVSTWPASTPPWLPRYRSCTVVPSPVLPLPTCSVSRTSTAAWWVVRP